MATTDSAKSIVTDFLRQFGLEDLASWAWGRYIEVGGGELGMAAFQSELPDQKAFQARFPAYKALAQKGRAMTAAEMLAYERTATQLMRAAGIAPGFYDQPEDFAKLMSAEVSVAELQQRVSIAQDWAYNADAATKATLKDYYGLDEGDLTAFALNDFQPYPQLQQKAVAAQFGGKARAAGVGAISRQIAEQLAQTGVDPAQADETIQSLADSAGLFRSTVGESVAGDFDIGADEQVSAAFGLDQGARRRVKRRTERRKAAFEGSTGVGVNDDQVISLTPVR
jgi:hypothetical protein